MNWKQMILFILVGYGALTILAYLIAPSMTYATPRPSYQRNHDTIFLTTADGVKIAANYYPNPAARYTILYCHGNATDIGLIKPIMRYFNAHGFAIFNFDYHGYGLSGGTPSEAATYLDAEAAYDYLVNHLKVAPERIIVYGKSLGAGVALQLSLNRKVAAVVMESPFLSAYRTYTQIPVIPFDKYRNLEKIKKLSSPLLLIHGTRDYILPFWQGKKLYETATVPKVSLWVENAGHNDVMVISQAEYWNAWERLIKIIDR